MTALEAGNLMVELRDELGLRVVTFRGESDAQDPGRSLSAVFSELTGALRGRTVELCFRDLSYMNSASVTPIMAFLRDLSTVAVKVTVRYRGDLQWQATSFRAMRIVARKWPNFEVTDRQRSAGD